MEMFRSCFFFSFYVIVFSIWGNWNYKTDYDKSDELKGYFSGLLHPLEDQLTGFWFTLSLACCDFYYSINGDYS